MQHDRLFEHALARELAVDERDPAFEKRDAPLEIGRPVARPRELEPRSHARLAQLLDRRELALRLLMLGGQRRQRLLLREALLLERRLALVNGQLASQGVLEETVVLRFGRLDIDSAEPGGRATITLGPRAAKR